MTSRVASGLRDAILASARSLAAGSGAAASGLGARGAAAAVSVAPAATMTPMATMACAATKQKISGLAVCHGRAFARETRWAGSKSAAAGPDTTAEAAPELGAIHAQPPPPWTPTRELKKRKTLPKRMGHLLSVLEKEMEDEARSSGSLPDFKPGDHLELRLVIPQNKGRETAFKGICIAKRNRGWRTSFTLRNFIGNNGGIERSFPLFSPHIKEIKVLRQGKARRAKLYYLRDVQPKMYRI
jgi:large subunit ribosomal protein L19